MTSYADVATVRQLAKDMDPVVIQCRSWGHTWQPMNVVQHPKLKYFTVTQRCPRCKLRRWSEMSARGQSLSGWNIDYNANPDYLIVGVGKIAGSAKDVLRLSAIMSQTIAIQPVEDEPRSQKTRVAVGMQGVKRRG